MIEAFSNWPALAIACAGALGLLVGSFLNVVILRLPARMQWQWERDSREILGLDELGAGTTPSSVGAASAANAVADADGVVGEGGPFAGKPAPTTAGTTLSSVGAASAANDVAGADGVAVEGGSFAAKPAPTTAGTAPPPGIVVEGSHCLKCGHKLAPWENIPLVSFLLLGGKCRSCRAPISWQYPAVELLTGLLFAAVVWRYGLSWQAGSLLVATGFFVAMSGIDARTTLLPDSLTLPLLWFGLLLSLVPVFVGPAEAILGAAVGYLSLWSVYWAFKLLTGKEGMGFGDFKLLAAIGAFCGWQAILPVVLMSSVIGAIVGITLIAVQGRDRATPIPFGPYLAAAGWVQMMYGGNLLDAYLRWVGMG